MTRFDFGLLCAPKVCRALVIKYKKDPRHMMDGLFWTGKEWVKSIPNGILSGEKNRKVRSDSSLKNAIDSSK